METEKLKENIRYNRALLDKVLERDGATLVGSYEKLNRDIRIQYVCKCSNSENRTFRDIVKKGAKCHECIYTNANSIRKKTYLEKFGVEFNSQIESVKKKRVETNLLHRGTTCPSKCPKVKEKTRQTNLLKYGVEVPTQNKDIYNKIKTTNKQKYGVECILQAEDIKEKIKNTNIQKYGAENPFASETIKEKIKEKNLLVLGVPFPGQSRKIKERIKETNIQKYGVEYPSQNAEIMEKTQSSAKKFKSFTMPSGTVRKVQGYEPFALLDLLKTYTEEQIKTDRKEVGRIKYKAGEKEKYYFPDIYLPDEKKFIEVKSTWTAKQNPELIEAKAAACREQGFACEVWVYNAKGERV